MTASLSKIKTLTYAVALLALVTPATLSRSAEAQAGTSNECQLITETGRYVCEPFLSYWLANQSVEGFGFPITGRVEDQVSTPLQTTTVQYFERQRLEHHPDLAGTPYEVSLGRLGVEALERGGRDWQHFIRGNPEAEHYFPETGHTIDPLFIDYWRTHGLDFGDPGISFRESLALFGLPISELMIETNSSFDQVVVQWFERARLEYHPRNPPDSRVLLGRLGAELDFVEPIPEIRMELVAEGFATPVALVPSPDDTGRLFVVDQNGLIWILSADGNVIDRPYADLRGRMVELTGGYDERGLLGLAFHPEYQSNGLIYIHYSAPLRTGAPPDWNHTGHVSEFKVSEEDANLLAIDSERVLLEIDQPHWAHNGGSIAFGPDGYLYIGLGDGGHGGDVGLGHVEDWYNINRGGNGQDIEANLLGSILRVDVDAEDGYGIPADNPFVDGPGLDEIWAYGFRNPFRFSFDMGGDNALFVGDVGQDRWEEIDIVRAGGNYGWNVREGVGCFFTDAADQPSICPAADPSGAPLLDPILEMPNSGSPGGIGRAIIGGYLYRGADLADLYGHYIFGSWSDDWSIPSGRIFFARHPPHGQASWEFQQLDVDIAVDGRLNHYVVGFGQGLDGELYVLTTGRLGPSGATGKIFRIRY